MKPNFERFFHRVKHPFHRRHLEPKDAAGRPAIGAPPPPDNPPSMMTTCDTISGNGTPAAVSINDVPPSEQACLDADAVGEGDLPIASSAGTFSELDETPDDDTSVKDDSLDSDTGSSDENDVDSDGTLTPTQHPSSSARDAARPRSPSESNICILAYEKACLTFTECRDLILKKEGVEGLMKEIQEQLTSATEDKRILRVIKKFQKWEREVKIFAGVVNFAKGPCGFDPIASTAIGVVDSVAKIAVALSKNGSQLDEETDEILEKLTYGLVEVYRKLLDYYIEAHAIFEKNPVHMAIELSFKNQELTGKMKHFLRAVSILEPKVPLFTARQQEVQNRDEKIRQWLGVDAPSVQSKYHADLREAREDAACAYLLNDERMCRWLEKKTKRRLAIAGNTGCGKSMIMSYLIDHIVEKNTNKSVIPVICRYYCRDDDSGKMLSILKELVYALLNQVDVEKKGFPDWYEARQSVSVEPAMSSKELEGFLRSSVARLKRPVLFAIDGLDECDRDSRDSLLSFLNGISDRNKQVKYLVSSRTQDHIQESLGNGKQVAWINLKPGLSRDNLIISKEVNRRLRHCSDELKEMVSETLSAKAEGNALWIRIVVSTIQASGITNLEKMRETLENLPLPDEMSQLYQRLFRHCVEGYEPNSNLAWSALKILAAARRDLTAKELAWGAAMAFVGESYKEIAQVGTEADYDRIVGLIRPFVTELGSPAAGVDTNSVSAGSDPDVKVRLTHQSVKQFVLAYGNVPGSAIAHATAPITESQSATSGFLPDQFMLDVCLRYLLLKEINEKELFTSKSIDIQPSQQQDGFLTRTVVPGPVNATHGWTTVEQRLPKYKLKESDFGGFFVYASFYWIKHLDRANSDSALPLGDFEELCKYKSQRLDNWLQQLRRPNRTVRPRYQLNSRTFDPLVVAAFYLPDAGLCQVLKSGVFKEGYYGDDPLVTATKVLLEHDMLPRLRLLLTHHKCMKKFQMFKCFRDIINKWMGERCGALRAREDQHEENQRAEEEEQHETERRRNWDALFDLVKPTLDTMLTEQWANDLFCMAAGKGCMPVVERLVHAAENNVALKAAIWGVERNAALQVSLWGVGKTAAFVTAMQLEHQSIGRAAANAHLDVVNYLLAQQDADKHLFHVNAKGETTLHLAARRCEPDIIRLLVPRLGAFLARVDCKGKTALSEARGAGYVQITKKNESVRFLKKACAERVEAERVEAERVETERIEATRAEVKRVEAEKAEAERVEAERVEAERVEAERVKAESIEADRVEAERAEAERVEAQRANSLTALMKNYIYPAAMRLAQTTPRKRYVGGILALVLTHAAMGLARRSQRSQNGRGLLAVGLSSCYDVFQLSRGVLSRWQK